MQRDARGHSPNYDSWEIPHNQYGKLLQLLNEYFYEMHKSLIRDAAPLRYNYFFNSAGPGFIDLRY